MTAINGAIVLWTNSCGSTLRMNFEGQRHELPSTGSELTVDLGILEKKSFSSSHIGEFSNVTETA